MDLKSNTGLAPYGVTLMYEMLVLRALHGLSDEETLYQVREQLSFQRFLARTPR